jgi:predicted nuclease of predicted toxin-antitoxin system
MKILLDECLPRRLLRDLNSHLATTVPRQGWAGAKDLELLKLAEDEFDIFITIDSNLVFQQNLKRSTLCIVVLCAANSRYETLQSLIPELLDVIEKACPGIVMTVG